MPTDWVVFPRIIVDLVEKYETFSFVFFLNYWFRVGN